MKKSLQALVAVVALVVAASQAPAAVVYEDTFTNNTSANYTVVQSGADSSAVFAFDYTGRQTADNGTSYPPVDIPPAPGATDKKALKLEVNPTAGVAQALNVYYNTSLSAAQHLQVSFDMFFRVNGTNTGVYDGGSGSSQRVLLGFNHDGTKKINIRQSAVAELPIDTDGYFFGIMGDGGFSGTSTTARDYEFREGSAAEDSPTLNCKWFETDATDARLDNDDPRMTAFFASPTADPPGTFPYYALRGGAPGDNWISVKAVLKQPGPTFILYINGTEVFQYTDPDGTWNSGGKFMIGLEDATASAAGADNGYALIDNLKIEQSGTDVTDWALYQ